MKSSVCASCLNNNSTKWTITMPGRQTEGFGLLFFLEMSNRIILCYIRLYKGQKGGNPTCSRPSQHPFFVGLFVIAQSSGSHTNWAQATFFFYILSCVRSNETKAKGSNEYREFCENKAGKLLSIRVVEITTLPFCAIVFSERGESGYVPRVLQ